MQLAGGGGGGNIMKEEIFNKFIESYDFKEKVKSITFAGLGEPLLNKQTPSMIRNAKKIAKETILVTNGSLLNKRNVDQLIEAEIDCVRISLQGLNASDYKKYCGFNIDYEAFLDNLSYFYKNKKHTEIWVKMPDIALDTEEKFDEYKTLFSDKCDKLTTMSIQPLFSDVDYSKMQITIGKSVFETENNAKVVMCSMPFYMLYLLPNGDIYPCCALERTNLCMGNISINSLSNIWNGHTFNNFRLRHCTQTYKNIDVCMGCSQSNCFSNNYDNIDSKRNELIQYYSKGEEK